MADEDAVFDRDALADERVGRDLHPAADANAFLNFDECADARFVTNLAAVEVDEVKDLDVAPQLDVGGDRLVLHSVTRRPSPRSDRSAASSMRTTRVPAAAPVSAARRAAIAAPNSSTTPASASRRSSFGAYMSPVRYDTRTSRRRSSSCTSNSTPLS